MTDKPRPGRPRRYDFAPVEGFANSGAAYLVAALDELTERLYDMLNDLPVESLSSVPEGASNSIAMLVLHMAAGEAFWMKRSAAAEIPADLEPTLKLGTQDASGDLPESMHDAETLVSICKRVREEVTRPAVSKLEDIDVEVAAGERTVSVRGALMHLVWHWTYHTGQVGLLRRLSAGRYQWRFDQRIAGA